MPRIDTSELLSGAVVATVGALFAYGALDYRMGTVLRMGPGFVPYHVGLITVVLGVLIMFSAFGRKGSLPRFDWRGMIFVAASILAFGWILPRAGLLPAAAASVVIACLAANALRPLLFPVLACAVALGSWAVFVKLLGMPIPVIRNPF